MTLPLDKQACNDLSKELTERLTEELALWIVEHRSPTASLLEKSQLKACTIHSIAVLLAAVICSSIKGRPEQLFCAAKMQEVIETLIKDSQ